jgi:dihydroorotase
MSVRPALIGRVIGHGGPVEVGAQANLTLIDPSAPWTVDPAALASKSRNTPFAGHTLPARVVGTLRRGRLTVADGVLVEAVPA